MFLLFKFLFFCVMLFLINTVYAANGKELKPKLQKKLIALTFDDGPRPTVLDDLIPLLESYNIQATFFVIGSVAEEHKELLSSLSYNGHEIENHSYGHENMRNIVKKKGLEAVVKSVEKTSDIIAEATDQATIFFRPPFWEITEEEVKTIEDMGYIVLKLSRPDVNTLDYEDAAKKRPVNILVERVLKLISSREKEEKSCHVLVFHELPLTVKALKIIIPSLKERGYNFVRLDNTPCAKPPNVN